jgi:hypothetical protein
MRRQLDHGFVGRPHRHVGDVKNIKADASGIRLDKSCLFTTNQTLIGILFGAIILNMLVASPSANAQPSTGTGIKSIDIYGKQCYTIQGVARSHAINPNIFDHVIIVKNQCFKNVKLKICYHKSDRCIEMSIPHRSTKESWLGSFPSMRFFQYDAKELPGLF